MNILNELRGRIRERTDEEVSEAVTEERWKNIEKAAVALIEAGTSRDNVILLLQKHWDLRLSDAKQVVQSAEEQDNNK